jgi:hypothetical protein
MDSEWFDHLMEVLVSRWSDAPELRDEWASMHPEEQVAHIEDFGVNGTHLAHVCEYAATHELTPEQQERWTRLQQVMAENRPILRSLGFRV